MKRKLKIIVSQFHDNSLPEFLVVLWKALFSYNKVLIYAKELDETIPEKASSEFPLKIVKGDAQELTQIKNRMERPPWEFSCHEYDNVRDFFWYKDDAGQVAHLTWIYYQGDPNRSIHLGPREAELKYGLTIPEYRGKRLMPAAMKQIQIYLKKKGYLRLYVCILSDNIASIKGTTRAGFTLFKTITTLKLFGVQLSKPFDTSTIFEKR